MAVTSTIEYCTDREVKDVFPGISSFDTKIRIYGWVTDVHDSVTSYIAYDTGLVTQLFIDNKGNKAGKQAETAKTTNDSILTQASGFFDVGDASGLTDSSYIRMNDEILGITNISSNTITVTRGMLGTAAPMSHAAGTTVYEVFIPNANGQWTHIPTIDGVIMRHGTDPNDSLIEGGDDWDDIKERFRRKASRFVESMLDSRIAREISRSISTVSFFCSPSSSSSHQ